MLLLPTLAAAQTAKHTGYIPAGNLKLYYEIDGSGPTLIFVHAGYLDTHCWDKQAVYFDKHYKVIRIDLPGHGHTKGIDTTILIADVLRIMMDNLHIKKASFVGESLGASCIVDFALTYVFTWFKRLE
jgi:pimeloyl-ACP methyl ester carboxylesterase